MIEVQYIVTTVFILVYTICMLGRYGSMTKEKIRNTVSKRMYARDGIINKIMKNCIALTLSVKRWGFDNSQDILNIFRLSITPRLHPAIQILGMIFVLLLITPGAFADGGDFTLTHRAADPVDYPSILPESIIAPIGYGTTPDALNLAEYGDIPAESVSSLTPDNVGLVSQQFNFGTC